MAGEFREARLCDVSGLDAAYELSVRLNRVLADAMIAKLLPQPMLDAMFADLADTESPLTSLDVVLGYCQETTTFVGDGFPGKVDVVISPAIIAEEWPRVFKPICELVPSPVTDELECFWTVLEAKRFSYYGYLASACELLSEWIEGCEQKQDPSDMQLEHERSQAIVTTPLAPVAEGSQAEMAGQFGVVEPLTDNDRCILLAMLDLNAYIETPISSDIILNHAMNGASDRKRAFDRLKANKLIGAKRRHGRWLTDLGKQVANSLGKSDAPIQPLIRP
ncbi:hypothetical protein [Rosistilla oblonga]|uniref:hypothetical protein n=1 Tax=Rosistilla oblonga TaxID=2527990 RepID=UPI0011AA4088|nr:hypothetical protein [Rosistilla oblonga]